MTLGIKDQGVCLRGGSFLYKRSSNGPRSHLPEVSVPPWDLHPGPLPSLLPPPLRRPRGQQPRCSPSVSRPSACWAAASSSTPLTQAEPLHLCSPQLPAPAPSGETPRPSHLAPGAAGPGHPHLILAVGHSPGPGPPSSGPETPRAGLRPDPSRPLAQVLAEPAYLLPPKPPGLPSSPASAGEASPVCPAQVLWSWVLVLHPTQVPGHVHPYTCSAAATALGWGAR